MNSTAIEDGCLQFMFKDIININYVVLQSQSALSLTAAGHFLRQMQIICIIKLIITGRIYRFMISVIMLQCGFSAITQIYNYLHPCRFGVRIVLL